MAAYRGSLSRKFIRTVWRKYAMRDLTASDNHGQLDLLYALPDPWNMLSDTEQRRFEVTNELIRAKAAAWGPSLRSAAAKATRRST